jgi:hypothetical protein
MKHEHSRVSRVLVGAERGLLDKVCDVTWTEVSLGGTGGEGRGLKEDS